MNPTAWIEKDDGEILHLRGDLALGRGDGNDLLIQGQGVSRRHALIHLQSGSEYWLADLGSRNGTFINGRRVSRPTRLDSGDRIQIGDCELAFKMDRESSTTDVQNTAAAMTVVHTRVVDCWLLVADVIGSTGIIREMEPTALSQMMGAWLSRCRDHVERCGGTINKFLGDGFFAYWPGNAASIHGIVEVLGTLAEMQEEAKPPFRLVLHRGGVSIGGEVSPGTEELIGAEVSRTFRIEKLAGSMNLLRLASQTAREGLGDGPLEFRDVGEHQLDGFLRPMGFHTW